MKINSKIISIPPYISAPWSHIAALQTVGSTLIVTLLDGKMIEIPGLDEGTIHNIFEMHTLSLDERSAMNLPLSPEVPLTPYPPHSPHLPNFQNQGDIPVRFAVGSIDEMGSSIFQHNPSLGKISEIPNEILEKIVAITKIVAPSEMHAFPKPEPHCNCVHCQVARAINRTTQKNEEPIYEKAVDEAIQEDLVPDSELAFEEWEIHSIGNQTYSVIHKIDKKEFRVYLGNPVGCTCGDSGCEHIIAVLKS